MATYINYKVTKEYFLQNTNNGLAFYEFIFEAHDIELVIEGKRSRNTFCPFYDDKNPSFSLFLPDEESSWRYKDYGDDDYQGDVFDFAAIEYDMNVRTQFPQLLERMYKDLGIAKVSIESDDQLYNYGYKLPGKSFDDPMGRYEALKYYSQFGISDSILNQYHVRAIPYYQYLNKEGHSMRFRCPDDQYLIAYEDITHVKLYQPLSKEYKFMYRGRKPKQFIFGLKQIIRDMIKSKMWEREILIIAAGEKDVMTLRALGYDAISLNSETEDRIPEELKNSILHNYKHVVVLYDLDDTGKKYAMRLSDKHGFTICYLPEELSDAGGKDVSDYIKLKMDVPKLHTLIKNSITRESEVEDQSYQEHEHTSKDSQSFVNDSIETFKSEPPYFTKKLYDQLPNVLQNICSKFEQKREKDLLLLSSLVVFSSVLRNVKSENSGTIIGTSFNMMISAPAASGKGVANWSGKLGSSIQSYLREQYEGKRKAYTVEFRNYKAKVKDDPTLIEPERPIRQSFYIPANNSVSKVYEMLQGNKNFGIIFETEGDTLANALKSEWGDFSDVLRKSFHHERLTLSRRGNDEFLEIDDPSLSVLLTGTPEQVNRLIDSVENGFFSRFMFYEFPPCVEWRSQFRNTHNGIPLHEFFEEVSQKVLEIWKNHENDQVTMVKVTDEQVKVIDDYFALKYKELYSEHGDGIMASIKRACVVWQRIAMILTSLRYLEEETKLPSALTITQEDASLALRIVDLLLVHLRHVYERIKKGGQTSLLNPQQEQVWSALDIRFTRSEYNQTVVREGVNPKTGEKYLNDFMKKGILSKIKHGEYRKL